MTPPVEVAAPSDRRAAEQLALVLAAAGIASRLADDPAGPRLLVAAEDGARARAELAAYEAENQTPPPRPSSTAAGRPPGGRRGWLPFVLVLLLARGAQWRRPFGIDWTAAGAADAAAIRAGDWWRAVTALTLHADEAHLLGNLAAGLAFGALLARQLGAGLAWFAILLTGALGNLADAWLAPPGHVSVGASTALFGALGMVAGLRRHGSTVPWRGGIRRWAPLSAGVLLLVFLGTGGERADVAAHALGFAFGVAAGLGLGRLGGRVPRGPAAQLACGGAALALLALAWTLALWEGGGVPG